LREAFAKRATLLRALAATNVVEQNFINKQLTNSAPTRAACHARLGDVIALEMVAPGSQLPLSSANAILAGVGKELESEPPKRRRLNEDAA
jgi:hypothetical protein